MISKDNGQNDPPLLESSSSTIATGLDTTEERRRNRLGSDHTLHGSEEQIRPRADLEDLEGQNPQDQQEEEAEIDPKTVGFRDRVGCYTWLVRAMEDLRGPWSDEDMQDMVHNDNGDWWDR